MGFLMDRIAFRDSDVRKLIKKSLMAFYELVESQKLEQETLEDVLKVYKQQNIPYVSKWLFQKGLDVLNELNHYEYHDNENYRSYVEMREFILDMDIEMQDIESLFISFTELLNTALAFAKENGAKDFNDTFRLTTCLEYKDVNTIWSCEKTTNSTNQERYSNESSLFIREEKIHEQDRRAIPVG